MNKIAIQAIVDLRQKAIYDDAFSKFPTSVELFKPLVAQFVPTMEQVLDEWLENPNGLINNEYEFIEINGVKLIYIGSLILAYKKLIGDKNLWNNCSEEIEAVIQLFSEKFEVDYYARCKEDFFKSEAADIAKKNNKKFCILDNMS